LVVFITPQCEFNMHGENDVDNEQSHHPFRLKFCL
jgi:hypothetical protein